MSSEVSQQAATATPTTHTIDEKEATSWIERRCVQVNLGLIFISGSLALWLQDGMSLGGFLCSLFSLSCFTFEQLRQRRNRRKTSTLLLLRFLFLASFASSIIFVYYSTMKGIYIKRRSLWDHTLLDSDHWLLGKVFPEGQLSLHVDKILLGKPDHPMFHLLSELFLLCYHSQFIFWVCFHIHTFLSYVIPPNWTVPTLFFALIGKRALPPWRHSPARWAKLQMIVMGWVTTALLCCILNFIFVASGPGVYLKYRYKASPLAGTLSATVSMRELWEPYKTFAFGSFPSLRLALAFYVCLASFRLGQDEMVAWIYTYSTFFSMFGCLFLRMHYATDLIGSIVAVALAVFLCGQSDRSINHLDALAKQEEETQKQKEIN